MTKRRTPPKRRWTGAALVCGRCGQTGRHDSDMAGPQLCQGCFDALAAAEYARQRAVEQVTDLYANTFPENKGQQERFRRRDPG